MAIVSIGGLGTTGHSTSSTSYTHTEAINVLSAGNFAILISVSDNISTVDGETNDHTSVTGGNGTWTKLGEYTNSPTGSAGDGVTVSAWLFEATATNSGVVHTLNFSSAVTDKCCSMWKFTKAAGTNIKKDSEPASNPITSEVTGANGFGSSSFSGLTSAARLYLRALAKEANTTTQITASTSFSGITNTRSRNDPSAVYVSAEFRTNTSTGETSNPTLAVSGDTAGLFLALVEYTVNGTHAVTLDAVTSSGSAGTVEVQGAASQTLSDVTSSAAGSVVSPEANGELSATLDAITPSAAGSVAIVGVLSKTLGSVSSTGSGLAVLSGQGAAALDAVEAFAAGTVSLPPLPTGNSYTTKSGDTWDVIAFRTLGSEFYMDVLLDANPDYHWATRFEAGWQLNVPEAPTDRPTSLPPWRRESAEATTPAAHARVTYTTKSGDTWDAIAFRTLGAEKYMSLLLDANPEHHYEVTFEDGTVLTVPELPAPEKPSSLPPWRL